METILYRKATNQDIPFLAKIRGNNAENEEHWKHRISGYLAGTHTPQKALSSRIIYVAVANELIVGFVAGHLTLRFNCQGELQWINVIDEYRRSGIASELVKQIAHWFVEHNAYRICVDPGTDIAKRFYQKNGAQNLNEHWMVWDDIRPVIHSQQ